MSAGKFLVGLLLFSALSVQAQDNKSAAIDPAAWLTYRNPSMGIEFNYPKTWMFHESPGNRVIASFSFTTAAGYQGHFILFNMPPVRSTFDHFLQRHQKQLAKAKRIPIGSEEGFEQTSFQCGQEDPDGSKGCAADFKFDSRALFSKGIDVNLDITVPYEQGRHYAANTDPYAMFKDEVDLARQVLVTVKIIPR